MAGQVAAHAGRVTVGVRDLDVLNNLRVTASNGSIEATGFMTPEATKEKERRLAEAAAGRKRKREGRLDGAEEG